MNQRIRTTLMQVGSFVLAGLLLYLAVRGVDASAIADALRQANYLWLIPLVMVVLVSHWLRAWRWTMLIEALPEDEQPRRRVPVWDAFAAVMIGYMVNYVAPRLGEVVRTANIATRRKAHFSSLFGTVVVERILDVLVLALGLASVAFLLRARFSDLEALFVAPLRDQVGRGPMILIGIGILVLAVAVFFLLRSYLRRSVRATDLWVRRVRPLASSFRSGLLTVLRSRQRTGLIVSTSAIWFCYLLMAYLPFVLLNQADPYEISLLDAWSIMILGAVGVTIPSPGGTGTYHYITIAVLTILFGMDHAAAATYAILAHAAQLILYAIVGFLCLLLQGSTIRSLSREAAAVQNASGIVGSVHDPDRDR